MIKHIVVWRIAETADKPTIANRAKLLLEGMRGKIPGLLHIEVGINFAAEETASDVVLYTELEDQAALERYQTHPVHETVKPLIKAMMNERRVVDYISDRATTR